MAKRKALSKKTRFEVFKRDGFKCQYCGAHPPQVLLHVDHIHAVANGGTNDADNLLTACEPCNLGKGATPLTDIPESLAQKAALVREREEQIAGFNSAMRAQADRITEETWKVIHALAGDDTETFDKANFQSVKTFVGKLGFWPTLEAAEIASAKFPRFGARTFSYFCGVCWSKHREIAGG